MTKAKRRTRATQLRRRPAAAVGMAKSLPNLPPTLPGDAKHPVHELGVHEVQLEAVNASLHRSELQLRQTAQAGNVGLWDWDLQTNQVLILAGMEAADRLL